MSSILLYNIGETWSRRTHVIYVNNDDEIIRKDKIVVNVHTYSLRVGLFPSKKAIIYHSAHFTPQMYNSSDSTSQTDCWN